MNARTERYFGLTLGELLKSYLIWNVVILVPMLLFKGILSYSGLLSSKHQLATSLIFAPNLLFAIALNHRHQMKTSFLTEGAISEQQVSLTDVDTASAQLKEHAIIVPKPYLEQLGLETAYWEISHKRSQFRWELNWRMICVGISFGLMHFAIKGGANSILLNTVIGLSGLVGLILLVIQSIHIDSIRADQEFIRNPHDQALALRLLRFQLEWQKRKPWYKRDFNFPIPILQRRIRFIESMVVPD